MVVKKLAMLASNVPHSYHPSQYLLQQKAGTAKQHEIIIQFAFQ